ncbi:serine/arginine repetitive matrix protein 1-like [Dermochelys coriacea]|uniref:serine/arginine repetitive matrix protein 1-like n=1 Tax=Dermochelys coriacea TaxID=27794 RepID=UPI001CA9CFDF|nr:serine/arginine repetitive matrix protein 1-like [Dermochelys coriacea]
MPQPGLRSAAQRSVTHPPQPARPARAAQGRRQAHEQGGFRCATQRASERASNKRGCGARDAPPGAHGTGRRTRRTGHPPPRGSKRLPGGNAPAPFPQQLCTWGDRAGEASGRAHPPPPPRARARASTSGRPYHKQAARPRAGSPARRAWVRRARLWPVTRRTMAPGEAEDFKPGSFVSPALIRSPGRRSGAGACPSPRGTLGTVVPLETLARFAARSERRRVPWCPARGLAVPRGIPGIGVPQKKNAALRWGSPARGLWFPSCLAHRPPLKEVRGVGEVGGRAGGQRPGKLGHASAARFWTVAPRLVQNSPRSTPVTEIAMPNTLTKAKSKGYRKQDHLN